VSSAVSASSVKAGASWPRNARSVGGSVGSSSRVEHPRAEAHADELLVEVGGRPLGEPGIDRRVEREHALRHAAGRGDDHDHQHLRLQREDLDVADRRGGDRRRRARSPAGS
jgi:hypothetical protein